MSISFVEIPWAMVALLIKLSWNLISIKDAHGTTKNGILLLPFRIWNNRISQLLSSFSREHAIENYRTL